MSERGFSGLRVADIRLQDDEARLQQWLTNGFHGKMHHMAACGLKRCWPDELLPGILKAVRMNYVQNATENCLEREISRKDDLLQARISLCAWGWDYHRVIRAWLDKFAGKMQEVFGPFRYREFSDLAPVMEVAFTRKAEMGWQGKKICCWTDGAVRFF